MRSRGRWWSAGAARLPRPPRSRAVAAAALRDIPVLRGGRGSRRGRSGSPGRMPERLSYHVQFGTRRHPRSCEGRDSPSPGAAAPSPLREARQLIRDLVVEAAKVAATEGYHFSYSLVERAEEVCRETSDNISSMLQDVRAGRQTEIEAITGEILRRGELASLPAPRTRVIWQLLKGLEKR